MPQLHGILETALYCENIALLRDFYTELFGLRVLVQDESRLCALRVSPNSVLLLFRKGGTLNPLEIPGGIVPSHDGEGPTHFAFSIAREDYDAWKQELLRRNIPIESEVNWSRGGKSIYFRDPENHSVELATPGIWAD